MRQVSILVLFLIVSFSIAETKPNVIFILMDDMGYSDISSYGAKTVETPEIDNLANKGLKFTRFYTAASICSPSRAAFLTGAYPQRCGLYMGINPNREAHWFLGLNLNEITIAEQFKKMNYTTLMVGKWHLGTQETFSYYNQGFDHYYGAPCNMGHHPGFYDEKKLIYKKTPLTKLTDLYTKRIIKHITDYKDKPFFLYYAHNYPHTPYQPSSRFKGSSKGGIRGDVIQELDWSIGQIVKALKENGILDNTMIIFTSDNGPTKNAFAKPFQGTKYVSLEGGHRVPFIIYWSKIKTPAVVDTAIQAMDLFPTLSDLINCDLPEDRVYDGVSLLPFIKMGKAIDRDQSKAFYYYNSENLQAIRSGKWKLHLPRNQEQIPFWDKNKKFLKLKKPLLFDLSTDQSETTDLADKHPEVVQQLLKQVKETQAKLGEYQKRGSEQRATGSLFETVPIVTNTTDWKKLTIEQKSQSVNEYKIKKKK